MKIDFETEWVHLRKSNTEPIIRIYTESNSQEAADALANRIIEEIKDNSQDLSWLLGNVMSLEKYFEKFRKEIIGIDETFETPFGVQKMIYADWTASGRLYRPIEEKMLHEFGPFVANTHTETTFSGSAMTLAYHEARADY